MTTNWRALCVELLDCLEKADWPHKQKHVFEQWIYITRRALAESEPGGPTRLPMPIEQALIKAECALSDIAEGEAEESEGDPLEWAEKRAADALARIRPVMRQHQIQTSEWPPLPAHALPLPAGEVEP